MPAETPAEVPDGLADVVAELYRLPPGDFTARRAAAAVTARDTGDKALAAAVRRLRRPTTSAWALNLLARDDPDPVDQLVDLGGRLREAQQGLDGAALRALDEQRRRLVKALAGRAAALAAEQGHVLDAEQTRQVEQTLAAALVDGDAGAAVASGQLTTALSGAGFGVTVDPDAVAVPSLVLVHPPREGPQRRPTSSGRRAGRAAKEEVGRDTAREAREVLDRAREEEAAAVAAVEAARAVVAEQTARLEALQREAEEHRVRLAALEAEVAGVEAQLSDGARSAADADEALLVARHAVRQAERRAGAAR